MRRDMGKVITERERSNSSAKSMKHGATVRWLGHEASYDDQPKRAKASSRGQYGYDSKEFTDVLGPLKGFIRKQVGRPWDKVYSELCQNLDKRKLTHAHVFTHVFQWVGKDVVFCKDGYYRAPDNVNASISSDGEIYYTGHAPDFFVHPKTGILKKNKPKESKAQRKSNWTVKQEPPNIVKLPDGSVYAKINDIWYHLKIREATQVEIGIYKAAWLEKPWEVRLRMGNFDMKKYRVFPSGGKHYYAEDKRQLGKKELKKLREFLEKGND